MVRPTTLGLLALLAPQVLGQNFEQECVSAIYQIYGQLTYTGVGYGDYWTPVCQNPIVVVSILAAAKTYCAPENIQTGIDFINIYCPIYGGGPQLPASDFAANLTDEAIHNLPVLGIAEAFMLGNISAPFLISQAVYDLGYKTEDSWDYEMRQHILYG